MKATVKTAISIDAKIFRKVERLTRRLHISRSQFFTQAAKHMIERDENLDLLQRINAAYEPDAAERVRTSHEKSYSRKKLVDEW